MKNTTGQRPQALQAHLSQKNIEIQCTFVFEDESVSYQNVFSVSMRGAQREITGALVDRGYVPAGRWGDVEEDQDGYRECSRTFKPGPDAKLVDITLDRLALGD